MMKKKVSIHVFIHSVHCIKLQVFDLKSVIIFYLFLVRSNETVTYNHHTWSIREAKILQIVRK